MTDRAHRPGQARGSTATMSPVGPLFGVLGVVVGVLTIIFGIVVLVLPRATLLVVAVLLGVELIILGIMRIVVGVKAPKDAGVVRTVLIVLGVLTLLAGIFCIINPGASLLVLAIFFAAGWIVDGIASFTHAIGSGRTGGQRTFLVLSGIVSVIAGLIVVVFPGASLVLLAQIVGVALVIVGIIQLVTAIAARRAARNPSADPRA